MDLATGEQGVGVGSQARARAMAQRLRDCIALAKPSLSALVLATTLVGFLLATPNSLDTLRLAITLLGSALAAAGANALNQCIEADRDARMHRTRLRPLPAGRLQLAPALGLAVLLSITGPALLVLFVGGLPGGLAATALLIYVLVYTPMKTRTVLNTLVGAVVGAIPPIIGWTAASGRAELGAMVLAGILFLWQIPHSLSLAWLHRDDNERGGYRMLPSIDPGGHLTCHAILLYSVLLLPLSLAVTLAGVAGPTYAFGSLLLGGGLVALVLSLHRTRTRAGARRVFLATITYLPLLLGLMLLDRAPAHPRLSPDAELTAAVQPPWELVEPVGIPEVSLPRLTTDQLARP